MRTESQLYNLSVCLEHFCRLRIPVDVHGGANVGVPYQLLLHPKWRPNRVNPRPVRMPECVRPNVRNPARLARTVQFTPKAGVGVGQSPDLQRACENPIAFR